MKKNYNYPKTEEVLLTTIISILGTSTTPMGDPSSDPFLAPKKQV